MESQSPAAAATHLEPNVVVSCCYHILCVDALQLHLLILMPFTLEMGAQRCSLLSPLCLSATLPQLVVAPEHPSSQLHRGEESVTVEQERAPEKSPDRVGNILAYATANPSVKIHEKRIISVHWAVILKIQGF